MKTKFIAEISSNHNQDLDRCFALIDAAARIGCAGVKFQLFKVEELFTPEAIQLQLDQQGNSLDDRKAWELPVEFLPALAEWCHDNGLLFSCTPFYLEAVKELGPYVDFYKIASYELLWTDLLVACAETGKSVVLSTGMATLSEIQRAVLSIAEVTDLANLTLLHCVSSYPAPAADCNLSAIETLRSAFGCKVGWSDHSVDSGVIYQAVLKWNASMVEFHFDLDGEGKEFSYGHCWLPNSIGEVMLNIKDWSTADGDGQKKPQPSELSDRDWRADPNDGLRPLLSKRKELE